MSFYENEYEDDLYENHSNKRYESYGNSLTYSRDDAFHVQSISSNISQLQSSANTLNSNIIDVKANSDISKGESSSEIHYGTSGQVTHGSGGDDDLYSGSSGDDLYGGSGNDHLNGGAGIDHAHYSGTHDQYAINLNSTGAKVVDSVLNRDGFDTLAGIERLNFSDTSVALDINGTAGQAYRLYKAAFHRESDAAGLGFWMKTLDKGTSIQSVASSFVASNEFKSLYGANVTDDRFVSLLYSNVLNRSPDSGGHDFWVNSLKNGVTREQLLVNFSESSENHGNTIGLIGSGINYQEYLG